MLRKFEEKSLYCLYLKLFKGVHKDYFLTCEETPILSVNYKWIYFILILSAYTKIAELTVLVVKFYFLNLSKRNDFFQYCQCFNIA